MSRLAGLRSLCRTLRWWQNSIPWVEGVVEERLVGVCEGVGVVGVEGIVVRVDGYLKEN